MGIDIVLCSGWWSSRGKAPCSVVTLLQLPCDIRPWPDGKYPRKCLPLLWTRSWSRLWICSEPGKLYNGVVGRPYSIVLYL